MVSSVSSSNNLGNVVVDQTTGRTRFTGTASGIDTEAAVNGVITARRIPIDRIQSEIDDSRQVVTGLKDARSIFQNLKNSVSTLYGKPTVDKAGDVFESKAAFAGTRRTDGATPSAAQSLLEVIASNDAEVATYNFEIVQRAQAQEVATANPLALSTAFGFAGTFQLKLGAAPTGTDPTIEVLATDTLRDIRDKVNAANTGPNASGVSARIVQVTSTTGRLILQGDRTGEVISFNDAGGVLNALDIINVSGQPTNEVKAAQNALIRLNDVPDQQQGVFSTVFTNVSDAVGAGDLVITNLENGVTETVTYAIGGGDLLDTLQQFGGSVGYASAPTGASTDPPVFNDTGAVGVFGEPSTIDGVGPVASRPIAGGRLYQEVRLADDGSGFRLHTFAVRDTGGFTGRYDDAYDPITGELVNAAALLPISATLPNATDEIAQNTAFASDPTLISRSTNTISDLFEGVTLNLLAAEEGTDIELQIQRDPVKIQDAITNFVDAYNQTVEFLNLQRTTDPLTGEPVEGANLQGTAVLGSLESALSLIVSTPARGQNLLFTAFSQIGITFVDNEEQADPITNDTLEIDANKLADALTSNLDDVRKLFTTRFSTTDTRFIPTSFDGTTGATANASLAITYGGGSIATALLTYANGSTSAVEIAGLALKVETGALAGAQFLFNGDVSVAGGATTTLGSTTGIGGNFFFGLDRVLDETTGIIENEIQSREDVIKLNEDRVATLTERLDAEREALTERFNRLESTLAQLNSLSQQISSAFGQSSSQ